MTENERVIDASPEEVWSVLADGWLYPLWVVGATRMRDVDESWPAVGSRLHHSIGVWPCVIDDETKVVAAEPPRRMGLRAKGWPLGEADVVIELEPAGRGTRVTIHEQAVEGPGRFIPPALQAPLIKWRNSETLHRLALVAEGRAS